MRTFTLEIHMENDAFDGEDAASDELVFILRDVAERVEDQGVAQFTVRKGQRSQSWSAVDTNGNSVGAFRILENRR